MTQRGVPDQITEARLREVVRSILNQEVRRLLTADASLLAQVTTNTGDIATNAAAITVNGADIEYNLRRLLTDVGGNSGVENIGSGEVSTTEYFFSNAAAWTIPVPKEPQLAFWHLTTETLNALFDDSLFDTVLFDAGTMIRTLLVPGVVVNATYSTGAKLLTITWAVAKSGVVHLLNLGSGKGYAVIAIAD